MSVDFGQCTLDHFTRLNFTDSENTKQKVNDRLCPKLGPEYSQMSVKGDYTNRIDRKSVAMKIRKCEPGYDKDCHDNSKIEELLEKLVITFYFATGSVELGNIKNYNKNPIIPVDLFHS